jgi:hypothetical protein
MLLTDIEMTNKIISCVKGSSSVKANMKNKWLTFTENSFNPNNVPKFIEDVNRWLKSNKMNIKVIEFCMYNPSIEGTSWEISDE